MRPGSYDVVYDLDRDVPMSECGETIIAQQVVIPAYWSIST